MTAFVTKLRSRIGSYFQHKKALVRAHPVISAVDTRLRYLFSYENMDNIQYRYREAYHWIAGTEVSEVQEQARYLESKLNLNRKDRQQAREQLDSVIERLRNITSELEHTGRGDAKAMHLRQLEYETIQTELKLSQTVQKADFKERETFTLLMNAVRESHETERNYNQRIKMISLFGAILGPFIGYLISARLNAMRFRRMEDIINQKLEILSQATICAIKEIHGIDPEVVSEPEKQGLIAQLTDLSNSAYTWVLDASKSALSMSNDFVSSLKEGEVEGITPAIAASKPTMVNAGVQANIDTPKSVVAKDNNVEVRPPTAAPQIVFPKFSDTSEFQALIKYLSKIENKQDNLKKLLIASHEHQDSNKIEVSVKSDDDIIKILQSDQQTVRKILKSIELSVDDYQSSVGEILGSLSTNIDNLSKKIVDDSVINNMEHSKLMNDMTTSVDDIKSSISAIESICSNDIARQVGEMYQLSGDFATQIGDVQSDVKQSSLLLDSVNQNLMSSNNLQQTGNSKIEAMLNELNQLTMEVKSESGASSVLEKIDDVINIISDIKSIANMMSYAALKEYEIIRIHDSISRSIDGAMKKIEVSVHNISTGWTNDDRSSHLQDIGSTMTDLKESVRSHLSEDVQLSKHKTQEYWRILNEVGVSDEVASKKTISAAGTPDLPGELELTENVSNGKSASVVHSALVVVSTIILILLSK